MKCIYCKGEMVRKTAPFDIDRKGYHLLLDAIQAWVCGQCGEAYFEEAEVDAIQEVLQKIDKETEKISCCKLIKKAGYLLQVSRYVVLNPVRSKIVESPDEWKWSIFMDCIIRPYADC